MSKQAIESPIGSEELDEDLEAFIAWNEAQGRAEMGDEAFEALDKRIEASQTAAANSPYRVQVELKEGVANAVWEAMQQKGVSQTELARRLGKSKPYVSKLLAGGQNLTLESLAQLSGALGCEVKVEIAPRWTRPQLVSPRTIVAQSQSAPFKPVPKSQMTPKTLLELVAGTQVSAQVGSLAFNSSDFPL